jgi:DNA repair protein RecO (recombination protein O)
MFSEKNGTDDEVSLIWKTILEKNINPSRIKKESRKKLLDSILLYYKCHFPDFYTPKSLPILVQILNKTMSN